VTGEPRPVIAEVNGLTYRHRGRVEGPATLQDVSLVLREAEVVVLTGASGSGKTTLLSIIGLLRRVPPGYVRLFGADVGAAGEAELAQLRRRLRFIFQKHYLLRSLTVLQNVVAGVLADDTSDPQWNISRATSLLEAVGLAAHLHDWPDRLSGGQQQRVAVARALVGLPDLLLADEPTASLDRESALLVADQLRDLAATLGCCVLLTTHDERIMNIGTRRLQVVEGRLVDGD
jgi:putative ABC transport system ATP-binding protein